MNVNDRQRLFVALPLSAAILQGIQSFRHRHSYLEQPALRWIPARNLHITLCFLGAVRLEDTPKLYHALGEILSRHGTMRLAFQCFALRPRQRPRMIWAQFRKQEHFGLLSRRIAAVCAPYVLSPRKPEKESIPHVTVARVKHAQGRLSVHDEPILPDLTVSSAELWSSELKPEGARYTSIASFALSSK